jgi:hypothetical protein
MFPNFANAILRLAATRLAIQKWWFTYQQRWFHHQTRWFNGN